MQNKEFPRTCEYCMFSDIKEDKQHINCKRYGCVMGIDDTCMLWNKKVIYSFRDYKKINEGKDNKI